MQFRVLSLCFQEVWRWQEMRPKGKQKSGQRWEASISCWKQCRLFEGFSRDRDWLKQNHFKCLVMDRLNRGKNWREKNNGQDTLTAVLARSGEGLPNTEAMGKARSRYTPFQVYCRVWIDGGDEKGGVEGDLVTGHAFYWVTEEGGDRWKDLIQYQDVYPTFYVCAHTHTNTQWPEENDKNSK